MPPTNWDSDIFQSYVASPLFFFYNTLKVSGNYRDEFLQYCGHMFSSSSLIQEFSSSTIQGFLSHTPWAAPQAIFFGIWTLWLYSHEYMKTSPWHCLAELSKVRIIFIETDEWLQLNVYICCIPENSKRMGKSDNNSRYLKIAKRILSVKIYFI